MASFGHCNTLKKGQMSTLHSEYSLQSTQLTCVLARVLIDTGL